MNISKKYKKKEINFFKSIRDNDYISIKSILANNSLDFRNILSHQNCNKNLILKTHEKNHYFHTDFLAYIFQNSDYEIILLLIKNKQFIQAVSNHHDYNRIINCIFYDSLSEKNIITIAKILLKNDKIKKSVDSDVIVSAIKHYSFDLFMLLIKNYSAEVDNDNYKILHSCILESNKKAFDYILSDSYFTNALLFGENLILSASIEVIDLYYFNTLLSNQHIVYESKNNRALKRCIILDKEKQFSILLDNNNVSKLINHDFINDFLNEYGITRGGVNLNHINKYTKLINMFLNLHSF
jgi:hypothetical protein